MFKFKFAKYPPLCPPLLFVLFFDFKTCPNSLQQTKPTDRKSTHVHTRNILTVVQSLSFKLPTNAQHQCVRYNVCVCFCCFLLMLLRSNFNLSIFIKQLQWHAKALRGEGPYPFPFPPQAQSACGSCGKRYQIVHVSQSRQSVYVCVCVCSPLRPPFKHPYTRAGTNAPVAHISARSAAHAVRAFPWHGITSTGAVSPQPSPRPPIPRPLAVLNIRCACAGAHTKSSMLAAVFGGPAKMKPPAGWGGGGGWHNTPPLQSHDVDDDDDDVATVGGCPCAPLGSVGFRSCLPCASVCLLR